MGLLTQSAQALCRQKAGVDDGLVARATAQIASDGLPHLILSGVQVFSEQFRERGEHARCAKPALQCMRLLEGLLQHREGLIRIGQALDRGDLTLMGLNRQHQTRPRSLVIDQNCASTTHAVLTADVGAGEFEVLAQKIRQGLSGADAAVMGLASDG